MTQQMNTRLIISAEDRGVSTLLRKMGTETDAAIDQFSRLGSSIAAAVGGFTAGYGVKKALGWIDEYKMDVLSVATMLTDTVRGSAEDIQKAFRQNKVHAEEFFKVLRMQARNSIATFDDLRNAYQIFGAKGLALEASAEQAATLANLVDRITMATRGQNQNIQVLQELRAILDGRARPTDALAKIFTARDANFQSTIKALVNSGSGKSVMDYLSSLLADVKLDEEIKDNLGKQLNNVRDVVRVWAMDAFMPLYDTMTEIALKVQAYLSSGEAPFLKGIEKMVDSLSSVTKEAAKLGGAFLKSDAGSFIVQAAPQMLAIASAAVLASRALALFKAAAMSALTVPGMITVGLIGATVGSQWAEKQQTREQAQRQELNTDWEYTKAFFADAIDGFLAVAKGLLIEVTANVRDLIVWIGEAVSRVPAAVSFSFNTVKANILEIFAGVAVSFDQATGFIGDIFVKVYYGFQILWESLKESFNNAMVGFLELVQRIPFIGGKASPFIAGFAEGAQGSRNAIAELTQQMAMVGKSEVSPGARGLAERLLAEAREDRAEALRSRGDMGGLDLNFGGYIRSRVDNFKKGYNATLDEWESRQARRAAGPIIDAAQSARDANAVTGKLNNDDASVLIAKAVEEAQKRMAKLANQTAGLESVIASLESATVKGGDQFTAAMAAVNREYASYRAKIVKLSGEQSASIESLVAEQDELARQAEQVSGEDRKMIDAKRDMVAAALKAARLDQAIMVEKERQADMERRLADATGEAANAIRAELAESQKKAGGLHGDAEAALTELRSRQAAVAVGMLDSFRREREATATRSEADRWQDELKRLSDFGAGLSTGDRAVDMRNAKLMEAVEIQRQVADYAAMLAPNTETAAQAQERLNALQKEYVAIFEEVAAAADLNIEKIERVASLMDDDTIFGGIQGALIDMADNVATTFENMRNLTVEVFGSMRQSMSTLFFDAFTGNLQSARDYFAAFGNSIIRTFSDMLAQMVVDYIAASAAMSASGGALNSVLGVIGGMFTGAATGAASSSIPVETSGGWSSPPPNMAYAANGAVFTGGFTPFASGGVVSRPTLGLVGEGRYNEAIVPLPDGRAIPVNMRGGSGVVVNVTDKTSAQKTVNSYTDENGQTVIDIIIDAAVRNRKNFRTTMRELIGDRTKG
jgi:hypothetical protein